MDEKENNQSISPGSSRDSSGFSSCSSPEVDVVAFTPRPSLVTDEDQKRYFCQRCLNHEQQHPRKGHKPFCQYANCECADCRMVEERRRLNNMLSRRRLEGNSAESRPAKGKKVRDPKCALCSAHGDKKPLRGHKKAQCPFLKCGCHLCGLVENRRTLMARQIKLRRDQQKQRKAQINAANATATADDMLHKDAESSLSAKVFEKVDEPLRVPPLMPVMPKPQPAAPIIVHPTTILPTSTILLHPMDTLDMRLMQFNYRLLNPLSFQFGAMFPYSSALPFLPTP